MRFYRTGLKVPQSGIYRVTHLSHRLPHEVALLQRETLPRCASCGDNVQFELIKPAEGLEAARHRVVVYELPEVA